MIQIKMKKVFLPVLIIIVLSCSPLDKLQTSRFAYSTEDVSLLMVGASLIIPNKMKEYRDVWILLSNGKISDIGSMKSLKLRSNKSVVINCKGKYIIPGMISYKNNIVDEYDIIRELSLGNTAMLIPKNNSKGSKKTIKIPTLENHVLPEIIYINNSEYKKIIQSKKKAANDEDNFLYNRTVLLSSYTGGKYSAQIRIGAPADLVVLNSNPLENSENLEDISFLVRRGYVVNASYLKNLLKNNI